MFTINDVDVVIDVEQEDIPIRGNLIDSGDENYDQKCEAEIISRLDSGDVWAWCSVKVTLTPKELKYTGNHSGVSYLGGCSYESQEEFEQCDYYKDMIDMALEDLNNNSKVIYEVLKDKFSG